MQTTILARLSDAACGKSLKFNVKDARDERESKYLQGAIPRGVRMCVLRARVCLIPRARDLTRFFASRISSFQI